MYTNRLRELRALELLSQNEIAKFLGIGRSAFSEYEIEYKIIPIKHLISICDYFNISLDYIFNFTESKTYSSNTADIDKTKAGFRLKEFRKEHKMTQKKLAAELNTVNQVISKYEKGINIIATPFLYTICKKYGISADYLLGKTDSPKYFK